MDVRGKFISKACLLVERDPNASFPWFTAGAAEGQKQLLESPRSGERGPFHALVHLGQMRRPCSKRRHEIPCGGAGVRWEGTVGLEHFPFPCFLRVNSFLIFSLTPNSRPGLHGQNGSPAGAHRAALSAGQHREAKESGHRGWSLD